MMKTLAATLAMTAVVTAGIAQAQTSTPVAAERTEQALAGCPSEKINDMFTEFGRAGRPSADLVKWLDNPAAQAIEPYQAFDNVYYVGICWVSAWIIKTNDGLVLIDTLYGSFTDTLVENIRKLGFDLSDIKMVLLTHGHNDHVGGVSKLKAMTKAKFVMTQKGWDEAIIDAKKSEGKPNAWTMPPAVDIIARDGDVLTVGNTRIYVFETPGHTWGTASYAVDVKDGAKTYRAVTVGGLGLNAIDGPTQVEAYIKSVDRLKALVNSASNPVVVHLTMHPFSTGLTEAKELLKTRQPGQPHPLVNQAALNEQLDQLRAGAVERLALEQAKTSKQVK